MTFERGFRFCKSTIKKLSAGYFCQQTVVWLLSGRLPGWSGVGRRFQPGVAARGVGWLEKGRQRQKMLSLLS